MGIVLTQGPWLFAVCRTDDRSGWIDRKLMLSDGGFVDTFRMSKGTFLLLCDVLEAYAPLHEHLHSVGRGRKVKFEIKTLVALLLMRLCQGLTFRLCEDMIGISHTHSQRIFKMLCHAACTTLGRSVSYSTTVTGLAEEGRLWSADPKGYGRFNFLER